MINLMVDSIKERGISPAAIFSDLQKIKSLTVQEMQQLMASVSWQLANNDLHEDATTLLSQIPECEREPHIRATYGKLLLLQGKQSEVDRLCESEEDEKVLIKLKPEVIFKKLNDCRIQTRKELAHIFLTEGEIEKSIIVAINIASATNHLDELKWSFRFLLRQGKYDEIAIIICDFLKRNNTFKSLHTVMGILGSLINQYPESIPCILQIAKTCLLVMPYSAEGFESLTIKLRERKYGNEAQQLITWCSAVTEEERLASLKRLKAKEYTNTNSRSRERRKFAEEHENVLQKDFAKANDYEQQNKFEEAVEMYKQCIPSVSNAHKASKLQWTALLRFAKCVGKLGDLNPLTARLHIYMKHKIIPEKFANVLLEIAERSKTDPIDLPEYEIGDAYEEYSRSNAMTTIIDRNIPKKGIRVQSGKDASVLRNVNFNRTGYPRKKRHS